MKNSVKAVVVLAIVLVGGFVAWQWGMARVYVDPGEILVINAKFGETKDSKSIL